MSTLKAVNLQHPTASTANITLSNTGGIALNGSVSGGGMDLITPTSVAGSGVTFSGGAISFSAATSISVNGCFSILYDYYTIIITLSAISSGDVNMGMRLRLAGTDASGATDYLGQQSASYGATVSAQIDTTSSWLYAAQGNTTYPRRSISTITMSAPSIATPTTAVLSRGFYFGTNYYSVVSALSHNLSIAYDGFSLISSSPTVSGTLRVYGLRNS